MAERDTEHIEVDGYTNPIDGVRLNRLLSAKHIQFDGFIGVAPKEAEGITFLRLVKQPGIGFGQILKDPKNTIMPEEDKIYLLTDKQLRILSAPAPERTVDQLESWCRESAAANDARAAARQAAAQAVHRQPQKVDVVPTSMSDEEQLTYSTVEALIGGRTISSSIEVARNDIDELRFLIKLPSNFKNVIDWTKELINQHIITTDQWDLIQRIIACPFWYPVKGKPDGTGANLMTEEFIEDLLNLVGLQGEIPYRKSKIQKGLKCKLYIGKDIKTGTDGFIIMLH